METLDYRSKFLPLWNKTFGGSGCGTPAIWTRQAQPVNRQVLRDEPHHLKAGAVGSYNLNKCLTHLHKSAVPSLNLKVRDDSEQARAAQARGMNSLCGVKLREALRQPGLC